MRVARPRRTKVLGLGQLLHCLEPDEYGPLWIENHRRGTNMLTELDVLDTFPTLKVAVAYKDPETGKELEYFPADLGYLERCGVVYREFEGWQTPTTAVKKFVRPSHISRAPSY